MRALGALVIFIGFIVGWAFLVVFWMGYQVKRLSSRKGRKEISTEIRDFTKFVATDKVFHKHFNKEFRGTYIIFGMVALIFIYYALGFD